MFIYLLQTENGKKWELEISLQLSEYFIPYIFQLSIRNTSHQYHRLNLDFWYLNLNYPEIPDSSYAVIKDFFML